MFRYHKQLGEKGNKYISIGKVIDVPAVCILIWLPSTIIAGYSMALKITIKRKKKKQKNGIEYSI